MPWQRGKSRFAESEGVSLFMTTHLVKNGRQSRASEPSPSPSMSGVLSGHETEKGSNDMEEGESFQESGTLPLRSSAAVPWEQFLSRRHMRVLLVENDKCTCRVITALLRNCSYRVISSCNGLEAWKQLNDPTSHFDLVLTEVDMPSLSGTGLLCQIMAHKAYRHIPVIMMSAQDSVGIVFKCLSKGAVDFLVKPVRKNELKSLWKHVWRRCHSSSGSGSGSMSETQNDPQPKSDSVASKSNTGSKDESDISLNIMDSSENGSGTQSSWTKRAVEIESPRFRCVQEKLIGSHLEEPQRNQASGSAVIAEGRTMQREIDTDMSQDLEIVTRKAAHWKVRNEKDKMSPETSACILKQNISSTGYEDPVHTIGSRGHSMMAIDVTRSIACKNKEIDEENGDSGFKIEKNKETHKEKAGSGCNFSSSLLEFTLKRSCAKHLEGEVQERKILMLSGSSAFSRYDASSNFSPLSGACSNSICPLPDGVGGSSVCTQSSGHDNGQLLCNTQPFKRSNDEPMEDNAMPGSVTLKDQVLRMSPGHAMPMPMPFAVHHYGILPYDRASGQYLPLFFSHPWPFSSSPTHPQPHHSPHHHHQSKPSDGSKLQKDEQTMTHISGNGPQWGSSNIANGPKCSDGQMGSNNSCASVGHGNESATGSNKGSIGNDGHNGHSNGQNHLISSTRSRISDSNKYFYVGAPLGNTLTAGGKVGAKQSQVAIREAALIKFRQKRKNRR